MAFRKSPSIEVVRADLRRWLPWRKDTRSLFDHKAFEGIVATVHATSVEHVPIDNGNLRAWSSVREELRQVRHRAVVHGVHGIYPRTNPRPKARLVVGLVALGQL